MHLSTLQSCKIEEPLMIYDPVGHYGEEYLICFNGESKYQYIQSAEDANMRLVDDDTPYNYIPPVPGDWQNKGKSDVEIERDWVTDAR